MALQREKTLAVMERMHHDQIRGVEPSYKPRFRSGREPDQRRPAASE